MNLKNLNPVKVLKNISAQIKDLKSYQNYVKIVAELRDSGKLESIGFSIDQFSNLYIGVDLNPELLMYSETSQESVELKMISEKMGKYTDFLLKEGILDSIKVDYDRVQNDSYYGYVVQISYKYTQYERSKLIKQIAYLTGLSLSACLVLALSIISFL